MKRNRIEYRYRFGIRFYARTIGKRLRDNKRQEMAAYLLPYLQDREEYLIADVGSGPVSCIGNYLDGKTIRVVASDVCQKQYEIIVGEELVTPIEYQDMERMTYKSDTFDIVHCANALDHTPDAEIAVGEMLRVCKHGGVVILRHRPLQKTQYARHHFWDITLENNETKITNGVRTFVIQNAESCMDGRIIQTVIHKP